MQVTVTFTYRFACVAWLKGCVKVSLLQLCGVLRELVNLNSTQRMFLLRNEAGRYVDLSFFMSNKHTKSERATPAAAPPPPTPPPSKLAVGLEMLTHGAESSSRNLRNPPEKTQGGMVRWSLGMHSEESVTYLLAELGELCLTQPLPPWPVCPTSLPLCSLFCSLSYPKASHLLLAPPFYPLIDSHSPFRLLIAHS